MITPRLAGAAMGLLASSVTIFAGLWARNPPNVTLSRALIAMAVFFVIGLLAGAAAQMVVRENLRERESAMFSGGASGASSTDDAQGRK